ncbi:MAG: tetratricopeptide repeat protein [Armatimonadetes bacterium]|nr:tetratricopeptide repeat protein [Armatimonadota bacterium]
MGARDVLSVESVRLYLDRASRAEPGLVLTDALAAVVAQLVARLEGLPLAIELAAACCRSIPPAELLARWDERLDLLADEAAEGRHRSLRVALAWSHDLLPERLQRYLAWLSVFRGGWSLAAAASVGGEPDALDLLAELRDASLVEVLDAGTEMRFRMLETVREFAAQKLAERGDEPAARAAHLRYCRELAEEGSACLEHEGEQRPWLVRFDTEVKNLRAALACACAAGAEQGLEFAGLLWRYWLVRGCWAEGSSWLERGLAAPGLPDPVRARALAWLGHLRFRRGLYAAAAEALGEALALGEGQCYERSLELRRADGNLWGVAASLGNLGAVAAATGDTAQAAAYLEEGLECRRRLGDRRGVAASLNNLGALAYTEGRYLAAEGCLAESLAIRQEIDDQPGLATVLNDLGALCHSRGQLDEAAGYYERSLAIRRDIGDRRGVAVTLANLGAVTRDRGDLAAACRYCDESVALHREMGDKRGLARALTSLGDLLAGGAELPAAGRCHAEALSIQTEIGDQRGAALSLSNLGEVARQELRYADAEGHYHRAAALVAELDDAWLRCVVEQGLGRLRAAQGRDREAAASYFECLTIRLGLAEQRGLSGLLEDIATLRDAMQAPEDAARWLGAAEAERERTAIRRSAATQAAVDRLAGGLGERLGAERLAALRRAGRAAEIVDLRRALAGAVAAA